MKKVMDKKKRWRTIHFLSSFWIHIISKMRPSNVEILKEQIKRMKGYQMIYHIFFFIFCFHFKKNYVYQLYDQHPITFSGFTHFLFHKLTMLSPSCLKIVRGQSSSFFFLIWFFWENESWREGREADEVDRITVGSCLCSPGEGNGNPLQYTCLEYPMAGGAGLATVHGVAKSQTRLSSFTHSLACVQSTLLTSARQMGCGEAVFQKRISRISIRGFWLWDKKRHWLERTGVRQINSKENDVWPLRLS